MDHQTINRLYLRVWQMHSGANYGGNIESTPPVGNAPLGKILIGNLLDHDYGDFMDPDLLRLLANQRKQPLVEIDTTWLRVGHVDEIIAVVPRGGRSASFVLLTASPKAAMTLLENAEARHVIGLPLNHPMRGSRLHPSGILSRLMDDGSAPVTRLHRGKTWMHTHTQPSQPNEMPVIIEPPRIYRTLADAFGAGPSAMQRAAAAGASSPSSYNLTDIGYVPGPGRDRFYPADITVRELLWCESDDRGQSTNNFIETKFMAPARNKLAQEFSGIVQLPLPVLFDRTASVSEWDTNPFQDNTAAFTPDLVNLQYLNGHVLIPRPYGPRMRINDAIFVVRKTMQDLSLGQLAARVGRRLISRHRLMGGIYWIQRRLPAILYAGPNEQGTIQASYRGIETESDIIELFRDSFPGASADTLRRRIIIPNRGHFDSRGNLKDGTHKFVINDDMVDLFELFTLAVMEEIGVRPHFVDSWFYHVHDGGIHCGTNVLRRPSRSQSMPAVWNVPDVNFRVATVNFEPEEVQPDSR